MDERYITSVDLGSSKIAVAVARVEGDNVQMIYYKETPSDGVRHSHVFNPQKVSAPLKKAIEDAEKDLGIKILQAVVGLPRWYVRQEIATAKLERTNPEESVSTEEVSVLKSEAVDSYPLDDESKEVIYGAVAQSFSVEDYYQTSEDDIVGMVSPVIEGNFKAFIGSKRSSTNIDMVFNNVGVAIADRIFTPDAVAKAVLTPEEMENGVALIEFGAGVTSVTIYHGGIMRHYGAIPFGGDSVTGDIKVECGISTALAENIKLAYGACMPDRLASMSEKILQISYEESAMEKQLPVKYLSEIITSREMEIVNSMLYEIEMSGYADDLRSGVVITGGGANIANCGNLIKSMSGYTVREGYPQHLFTSTGCQGIAETDATVSVGMILAAKEDQYLNCTKDAPVRIVAEAAVEPEAEPEPQMPTETLFSDAEMGPKVKPKKTPKVRPPKPQKTQKERVFWTKLKKGVIGHIDSLYEGMEDD